MALAGLAAINQQSFAGMVQQMDAGSYHSNEADRNATYGGNNEAMVMGGAAASAPSSNAAMALGMLATQSAHNGNAFNHENQNNDQPDHGDFC